MKRNLVGKTLGKIKIFVQDFVPIRTALTVEIYFICGNPGRQMCKGELSEGDNARVRAQSTHFLFSFFLFFSQEEGGGAFVM